jgi:hypothetical protein
MSVFGKLDAKTVSTNPYFIKAGDYEGEILNAEYATNRDDVRQLVIEYVITTEDSPYNGSRTKEYFPMVSENMTQEMFDMLPPEEQKKIRTNNANLKKRLCGYNDKNTGLGVSEDDLNDENWTPAALKGISVRLGISNGNNDQYTNIKYVVAV